MKSFDVTVLYATVWSAELLIMPRPSLGCMAECVCMYVQVLYWTPCCSWVHTNSVHPHLQGEGGRPTVGEAPAKAQLHLGRNAPRCLILPDSLHEPRGQFFTTASLVTSLEFSLHAALAAMPRALALSSSRPSCHMESVVSMKRLQHWGCGSATPEFARLGSDDRSDARERGGMLLANAGHQSEQRFACTEPIQTC